MFGGPPEPNFTGAAREQAAANRQLTSEQTYANRPDIYTPWGSMRWSPPAYDPAFGTGRSGGPPMRRDDTGGGGGGSAGGGYAMPEDTFNGGPGAPGRWRMDINLTPEQQAALESQQRLQAGRSGLAEALLGRAQTELGAAPDYSNLPEFGGGVNYDTSGLPAMPGDVNGIRNRAEEALYGRATSRLNPEWAQREQQLDSQLRAQGVMPGSQAYQREMSNLDRSRELAYAGARQDAIAGGGAEAQRQFGLGLAARQQGVSEAGQRFGAQMQASQYQSQRRNAQLSEMLMRRGWSLNEINALLSGQQVNAPQMPGFAQAGVSQGPNLTGAMGQQYEAQLNAYNAQQAQLQSLMRAGIGIPTMFATGGAAAPMMF